MINADLLAVLHTHHPELLALAKPLTLRFLESPPLHDCCLEIEASFGWRASGATQQQRPGSALTTQFRHGVPEHVSRTVLAAFDHGKVDWVRKDNDWVLVEDTYVRPLLSEGGARTSNMTMRVRREMGTPTEIIEKKTLLRCDMDVGGDGALVRVSLRTETPVRAQNRRTRVQIAQPESVRLSTRRRFRAPSPLVPGCNWQFEMLRAWHGPSLAHVEAQMRAETTETAAPMMQLEIETTLRWDVKSHPSAEAVLLACIGLLCKVQDIMDLLGQRKHLRLVGMSRLHVPNASDALQICRKPRPPRVPRRKTGEPPKPRAPRKPRKPAAPRKRKATTAPPKPRASKKTKQAEGTVTA